TAAERRRAEAWLPDGAAAPRWSVAAMELGAQVCRASNPRCEDCPVRAQCRWHAAGRPAGPPRPRQLYAGTDRAARGHVLHRLRGRDSGETVAAEQLVAGWPDAVQADRALRSLAADGLIVAAPGGYRL
ncbi:MAG: A/G-specific adenine glycosylase, partial [Micropruina sp.]